MTAMGAILEGVPYPLRAMIMTGANPALTNPNTTRVREALTALDLLVVRDLFMSESAELAHYVLPAASFLERTELHAHAKRQVVTLTRRILHPSRACRASTTSGMTWPIVWASGNPSPGRTRPPSTGGCWSRPASTSTISPSTRRGSGTLRWRVRRSEAGPLPTPSGKIEFTSSYLRDLGFDEIPVYRSPAYVSHPDPDYPFVLMTGARKLLYLHSRFRNIPRFRTATPGPEVEMHPADAARSGPRRRRPAFASSRRIGSVEIPVRVMAPNELLPGTLQITHGWKRGQREPDHPRRSFRSRQRLPAHEVRGGAGGAGVSRRRRPSRLRSGARMRYDWVDHDR